MEKSARLSEEELHTLGYTVVGSEAVPLGDATPDSTWDEDRLALYFKGELANSEQADEQAILQAQKSAVHLFRAGHALFLARDLCKHKGHGMWTSFKHQHDMKDTTANDAIRLYVNAKTEDALLGLGITEAKVKYVYPFKDDIEEEDRQVEPKAPKKSRKGRKGDKKTVTTDSADDSHNAGPAPRRR